MLRAITPQRSLIKPTGLGDRIETGFFRTSMADRANALREPINPCKFRRLSLVLISGLNTFILLMQTNELETARPFIVP